MPFAYFSLSVASINSTMTCSSFHAGLLMGLVSNISLSSNLVVKANCLLQRVHVPVGPVCLSYDYDPGDKNVVLGVERTKGTFFTAC